LQYWQKDDWEDLDKLLEEPWHKEFLLMAVKIIAEGGKKKTKQWAIDETVVKQWACGLGSFREWIK